MYICEHSYKVLVTNVYKSNLNMFIHQQEAGHAPSQLPPLPIGFPLMDGPCHAGEIHCVRLCEPRNKTMVSDVQSFSTPLTFWPTGPNSSTYKADLCHKKCYTIMQGREQLCSSPIERQRSGFHSNLMRVINQSTVKSPMNIHDMKVSYSVVYVYHV